MYMCIYSMFSVKWIQDIQVVVSENVSEYKCTMYRYYTSFLDNPCERAPDGPR